MKKAITRGLALLLLCASIFALPIHAAAASALESMEQTRETAPKYDFPAGSASVIIELDGKIVLDGEAAIIDSVTYVPVRSASELFGAESISWNASTRIATVKKGNTTIKIGDRQSYIEASGRYFYFATPTKNISDRLFVPIRALAKAFCVEVDWDADRRTVLLENTGKTLQNGSEYYNSDDLYWLSRIISAESAGEPLLGKIAVGNVVINRKASPSYPNSIYGVIFDRRGGTQFSPVSFGTIYNKPTAESVLAAKICLDGYSVDTGILFFMNPKIATNSWISNNRPFAFRVGNHYFFY